MVTVIINRSLNTVPRVLDIVKVSPQVAGIDDGRVVGLKDMLIKNGNIIPFWSLQEQNLYQSRMNRMKNDNTTVRPSL